jgi:hypothetical protein
MPITEKNLNVLVGMGRTGWEIDIRNFKGILFSCS